MRKQVKFLLHGTYLVCLLLMVCFAESKYAWMADVDPSISADAIADDSGNRAVFSTIMLLIAVATQVVVAIKSSRAIERVLSALLGIAAIAIFIF